MRNLALQEGWAESQVNGTRGDLLEREGIAQFWKHGGGNLKNDCEPAMQAGCAARLEFSGILAASDCRPARVLGDATAGCRLGGLRCGLSKHGRSEAH